MMKKAMFLILFLVPSCMFVLSVRAAPVSIERASQIAENQSFMGISQLEAKGRDKVAKEVADVFTKTKKSRNIYYVINLDPEGWVIISADDVAYPIIAYSDTGAYTEDEHPPAFDAWMKNVEEEINQAIEDDVVPLPKAEAAWDALDGFGSIETSIAVNTLVQTTWNQGGKRNFQFAWLPSYDMNCPVETNLSGSYRVAPTGCLATAMGQIMKYWSWPSSGKGSHSYDPWWPCENQGGITCHGYGVRDIDFSTREYAWQSMPNAVVSRISGNHTWGEQQVQLLMRDLGVALDMNYHPINGSGACLYASSFPVKCDPAAGGSCDYYTEWSSSALYAFVNFFRYDTSANYKYKSNHPNDWHSLLETELDNGRPVLYKGSGAAGAGGHAFVCDGYDTNESFHFNWGWGGRYNGWYYLNSLTPGSYNFTSRQASIFNLKPETPDLVVTRISIDPPRPGTGQSLNIAVTVKNQGQHYVAANFFVDWYAHRTSPPGSVHGDSSSELGLFLAAGASHVAHLTYPGYTTDGLKRMYAQVDSANSIGESDEYNNILGPQLLEVIQLCDGDFNGNGNVDEADLTTFSLNFGHTDCAGGCDGDFGTDGDVDGADLARFTAHYGRTDCP